MSQIVKWGLRVTSLLYNLILMELFLKPTLQPYMPPPPLPHENEMFCVMCRQKVTKEFVVMEWFLFADVLYWKTSYYVYTIQYFYVEQETC